MTKRSIAILATGTVLALGGVASANVSWWSDWFSEGGQYWRTCPTNYGVQAMQASGNYSDNLAIGCTPWVFGSLATGVWTPLFNSGGYSGIVKTQCALFPDQHEECDSIPTGSNVQVCFGGFGSQNKGVVAGIACYDDHCDTMSLLCKKPTSNRLGNCSWSGTFSDEQRLVDFGPGRYITGVECSGHNCDNMRFYVCSAMW